MKRNFTLIVLLVLLQYKIKSQNNNPTPYCLPTFSQSPCNQPGPSNAPGNYINDFINSFATSGALSNISNFNSGCNGMPNNYIYYCNHNLVVNPSQVITCTVQSGTVWAQGFSIFIDWNQDLIFNLPSERVAYTAGIPPAGSTATISFTVPPAQTNGTYRMRVRCYYINGIAIDPCNGAPYGETEDYNLYVGISPPPAPVVTATASNNSPICAGQTLSLTANITGTGVPVYNWSGPLNYTSAIQNPVISNVTFSMGGTYWVAVTTGTCPVMASTYALINQAPALTVSGSPSITCPGITSTLTVSGSSNYTWSTGSNSATTVVSPTVSTIYSVSANNGTCTSYQTYTRSVYPGPTLQATSSSSLLCSGSSATLTAGGANNYTWIPGGTGSTTVVSPTITTTYSLAGTNGTCTSYSSFTQSVVICSGLNQLSLLEKNISIFPNPFRDELTIKVFSKTEIKIFNSLGQAVLQKTINSEEVLNTEFLSKGVYYLSYFSDGNRKVAKVIKN